MNIEDEDIFYSYQKGNTILYPGFMSTSFNKNKFF